MYNLSELTILQNILLKSVVLYFLSNYNLCQKPKQKTDNSDFNEICYSNTRWNGR